VDDVDFDDDTGRQKQHTVLGTASCDVQQHEVGMNSVMI